jgi:predicted secreted protein
MATISGTKGIMKLEATGTSVESLLNLTSYTLDTTQDTIEVSRMGMAGGTGPTNTTGRAREYVKGMTTFTGSADFQYDATNPQDGSIAPLNFVTDTVGTADFELFPEGEDAGAATDTKFSGQCIVTGFSITASVDGIVTGSLTFQGNGDLTVTHTD